MLFKNAFSFSLKQLEVEITFDQYANALTVALFVKSPKSLPKLQHVCLHYVSFIQMTKSFCFKISELKNIWRIEIFVLDAP